MLNGANLQQSGNIGLLLETRLILKGLVFPRSDWIQTKQNLWRFWNLAGLGKAQAMPMGQGGKENQQTPAKSEQSDSEASASGALKGGAARPRTEAQPARSCQRNVGYVKAK